MILSLADRSSFGLGPGEWQRFNELLDRPAAVPAGLEWLFSRPNVFED